MKEQKLANMEKKATDVKDLAGALDQHRKKTTARIHRDIIMKIKWHMWETLPCEMGLFLEDPKDPEKMKKLTALATSSDTHRSETNKQSRGTKR
jgi:hypothetical protein